MTPLVVLTDRAQLPPGADLVEHLARCVEAGLREVVLRERDLPDAERASLARELAALLRSVGGRLVVASPPPPGAPYDALHHPARELGRVRPPRGRDGWSTHDADELRRAVDAGAGYVTVSPYALTASKPGYGPALGEAGLRALIAAVHLGETRVYALGGITAHNAAQARRVGAHGVAVMGEVMRSPDPGTVVRDLMNTCGSGTG